MVDEDLGDPGMQLDVTGERKSGKRNVPRSEPGKGHGSSNREVVRASRSGYTEYKTTHTRVGYTNTTAQRRLTTTQQDDHDRLWREAGKTGLNVSIRS